MKFNTKTNKTGFTLIELLVVIAIISLLSSVVLTSLDSARDKARYARAKMDIKQLKIAMLAYKLDNGELPPPGDNCSACSEPPSGAWLNVINALVSGNYLSGRIDRDPWGNYYAYDDNDCNSGAPPIMTSYLFTTGADKLRFTADDYRVNITQGCAD